MEYTMTKFIKKYFKRYCDTYLPGETEELTAKAEIIFDRLMHETPDLGGKDNMMASNMDITCAFFAYYEASDHRIGGEAMEILINWLAKDYKWVSFFTDMNKRKFIVPLYYKVYSNHARTVEEHRAKGEWEGTWSLEINPDNRRLGINYHMKGCPLLAFVRAHGYDEMMPYVCKFDYIFEKLLRAKLIRSQTEATGGDCCDYWFVPDQSSTARAYEDYLARTGKKPV